MYGEHGSHMFFATHASILTRGPSSVAYRVHLRPDHDAPLPLIPGFGARLSPAKLSAQPRLTSELLRTL